VTHLWVMHECVRKSHITVYLNMYVQDWFGEWSAWNPKYVYGRDSRLESTYHLCKRHCPKSLIERPHLTATQSQTGHQIIQGLVRTEKYGFVSRAVLGSWNKEPEIIQWSGWLKCTCFSCRNKYLQFLFN
jgi:hypothetical protein